MNNNPYWNFLEGSYRLYSKHLSMEEKKIPFLLSYFFLIEKFCFVFSKFVEWYRILYFIYNSTDLHGYERHIKRYGQIKHTNNGRNKYSFLPKSCLDHEKHLKRSFFFLKKFWGNKNKKCLCVCVCVETKPTIFLIFTVISRQLQIYLKAEFELVVVRSSVTSANCRRTSNF